MKIPMVGLLLLLATVAILCQAQEEISAPARPKRQFLAGVLVGSAIRRPTYVTYNTYPSYHNGYYYGYGYPYYQNGYYG